MYKRIHIFLEILSVIYDVKIVLLQKYSMSLIDKIWEQLDSGHFDCGIFIHLKKTFDTVDHNIFIQEWITMTLEEKLTISFHVSLK